MSRELFKSMVYKDNKVYTRQCSNNVNPKNYDREENKGLTRLYQEKGQEDFEKYFLTNLILEGNVEILSGCNNTLRRLNYLANLLWKDKEFIKLRNKEDEIFRKSLNTKIEEEKNDIQIEFKNIKEDIKNDIKAMNITPDYGSDIRFIDYNDMLYTLKDINSDNKIRNSYDMYLNANYELSPYLKWEYSKEFIGKKVDYDFMSNYVYVKDNILYRLNYTNEKYPDIYKVSGNYEGEKVIRIYNERILKTDKAFYEIVSYFDKELNKNVTTTMKIKLLTKYYNDVLTFTYKYVILKDYTLIPINDVMINRANDYQYNEFISSFNSIKEVPKVFEE